MADRRVVVADGRSRAGWLIGAVLVLAAVIAVYFYFNGSFSGYGSSGTADGDTEIVLPAGD